MSESMKFTDREDVARVLSEGWREHTRITEGRALDLIPRERIYASGWKPCVRAMTLDLLYPGDRGVMDDSALERFARGNEIERSVVARLSLAGRLGGWTIEGAQKRFEIKGRSGKVVISGKVDGMIRIEGQDPIPFDVKSGQAIARVQTLEDLDRGRWTRHMPFQLLAYMFGAGVPFGVLILDQPSGPRFVVLNLADNLDRMEGFLQAAETAVEAAAAIQAEGRADGTGDSPSTSQGLPEVITDPVECSTCDHFKRSCFPPLAFGEGLTLITDPDLIEAARTRKETASAAKDFERADKLLKSKLRGCELGSIGGEFDVIGKWQSSTSKVYPERCEGCGARITPEVETNPKGRFLLTISSPGDEEGEV